MSTLNVNTVQSSTSNPPIFKNSGGDVAGTLCRAWVNFDGTNTVAIRDSYNVSSITDVGEGEYTINFTNALSNANYSWVGTCGAGTATTNSLLNLELITGTAISSSMTTTSISVETVFRSPLSPRNNFDAQFVSIAGFSN